MLDILQKAHTSSGSHQPAIQWVVGTLTMGKVAEVMNVWGYTSAAHCMPSSVQEQHYIYPFQSFCIMYVLHYNLPGISNFSPLSFHTFSSISWFNHRVCRMCSAPSRDSWSTCPPPSSLCVCSAFPYVKIKHPLTYQTEWKQQRLFS
jgi:hypothetical protein